MVVTVVVQPEADSTRLIILARSLCAIARPPPPGFTVKVEDTFELRAAMNLAFEVVHLLMRDLPTTLLTGLPNPRLLLTEA